jgi:hypothetical protein
MFPPPLQDDHCWLTINGEAWAIRRWRPPTLYLWRGYHPHLQYTVVDVDNMTEEDWDNYCDKAVKLIRKSKDEFDLDTL